MQNLEFFKILEVRIKKIMLNTHKLLYLLPDLAYVAELLAAKKEYTFSVQSFRQINGEFIDENELIPASIDKLFSKLEKEEYHLILPDFLFTNTIVNIAGTSESTVLDHVNTVLLPTLDLAKETHEIQTTVLTSFKGTSKVQISAIEKSILAPLRAAAKQTDVTITAISPLTWAVKAIISLEPSISVLQMGAHLYAAQHYIGVDQASNFPIDEYDAIVETIKTLKGAEPSIQSVYLASSLLVEEDIKSKLSDTIPIQQLTSFKEDDSKMPTYVKFIIESTMRTLSIPDFPVPRFKLGKATQEDLLSLTQLSKEGASQDSKEELETSESQLEASLPEPSTVPIETEAIVHESSKTTQPAASELPVPTVSPTVIPAVENIEEDTPMTENTKEKDVTVSPAITEDLDTLESMPEIPEIGKQLDTSDSNTDEPNETEVTQKTQQSESVELTKKAETQKEEIDLSKFATKDSDEDNGLAVEKVTTKEPEVSPKKLDKPEKKIIKNSSGVNNMLKMVFITVAVFFITIAIGIGVGLGLLKISENKPEETTPTVVAETPAPTPTPTAVPVEINKTELSILVVNATTKAGYAGKIRTLLTTAKIEDITATNAKGEYEDGVDYILMSEENPELQSLLEEATKLTFEYSADTEIEDPTGKYDAVIVLAK